MSNLMWAAQLKSIGQPLELSRIAIPKPGSGELLVKLEASGIWTYPEKVEGLLIV